MQLRLRPGLLGSVFFLFACGETPAPPPEPLDLPDWEVCLQDYGGDADELVDAVDRGEKAALICNLALIDWRDLDREKFELLYRLYRMRGREPEGLDALVRGMDRQTLAARLRTVHWFSAELEEFDRDWRGCSAYDPIARELLLRARLSEDDDCLPKRRVFWG